MYWGEYPLSFAACLGQEECYRLMLARGANPNNKDTNGNTVLHMLVIYEKMVRKIRFTCYELHNSGAAEGGGGAGPSLLEHSL